MLLFLQVGETLIRAFAFALISPIFWIVLLLVLSQYRRQAAIEEKLFGRRINSVKSQMLISFGYGVLGGFIASAALVFLGLSLEQIGLYLIWPVALLLLLFNPRYLCFSYAGGIVAVLVLGVRHILVPLAPGLATATPVQYLLQVHIPALLVLIALLHLVEALLIYLSGHRGSSPIYLKKDGGSVVGAFSLQRFWPLPLVALLVQIVSGTEAVGVAMPQWWPILRSTLQPGEGQILYYAAIPVAAGLGYGDMAVSSAPAERSRYSAGSLALYSLLLFLVAITAEYYPTFTLPGVIFAPLGHEVLILHGKKKEEEKEPRFQLGESGVSLMMVLPNSPASEAGLLAGDVITAVNGIRPTDNRDLVRMIEESYFLVLLEVQREDRQFSMVLRKRLPSEDEAQKTFQARLAAHSSYSSLHRGAALGLITVPAPDSPVYLELARPDPLARFRRLKERLSTWA